MNEPLDLPQAPPEFEQLLQDPRLEGFKDGPSHLPPSRRTLMPANPPVAGESRYLLYREYDEESFATVDWLNDPGGISFALRTGNGQGFKLLTEQPRFREGKKKPARRADAWTFSSWLIVSPGFADILRRFDPDAIETVPIDWTFKDGGKLEGYQFLDVRRRLPAYDYARTAVEVTIEKGKKYIAQLDHPRALKRDIDPSVHLFRDSYFRTDIFMSRALARALTEAGMQGIRFEDPANTNTVEFN